MIVVIDPARCNGCRMCEMACSAEKEGVCSRTLSRIKVMELDDHKGFIPHLCMQCVRAPCVAACPVNAMARDRKTNAVIVDDAACIGCSLCVIACPLQVISCDPGGAAKGVVKCDLCDGDPQCVRVCEPKAINLIRRDRVFGRTQKIAELLGAMARSETAFARRNSETRP